MSGNAIANAASGSTEAIGYTPAQVRAAYGVNNLALDGAGQTIGIVVAYHNPTVYQALDAFEGARRAGRRWHDPARLPVQCP